MLSLVVGISLAAGDAVAQEWATKMFKDTSHNFGSVARGAKVEYRFQFYNPYKEAIHVAAVSSSCGCTTPEIEQADVKTYGKSAIIAKFNTKSFTGNHSATITVTIDKPYYATVQLNVSGDIRGEFEVLSHDGSDSGAVDFGTIDQGDGAERRITVVRYGGDDWQIKDVRSVDSNYEVEVIDGPKNQGQVSYDLKVKLKKDQPAGYLKDPLILVTNDANVPQLPIEVNGLVRAELSVRPEVLTLGTVQSGQQVTNPLVITGRKPFKITGVHCDDDSFAFKTPIGAGRVWTIPVTFTAPNKPGKLIQKIRIDTDLGNALGVEVSALADVTAPTGAAVAVPAPPKPPASDSDKAPATSNTTTEPVFKLDSGTDRTKSQKPDGSTRNSTNSTRSLTGSTTTIVQPVESTVIRRASAIPNPIRSNSAQPTGGNSALSN